MNTKMKAGAVLLVTMLSGCASVTKSALLGAAIGGVAGGLIGQNNSHTSEGTAVGVGIGAGLGSLIGYGIYQDQESKKVKPVSDNDLIPSLTRPKIKSIVVPDTIEGNKFIKSHRVFILEDPGSWSKE